MNQFAFQSVRVRHLNLEVSSDVPDIASIDRSKVAFESINFLTGITVSNHTSQKHETVWRYRFDILLGVRVMDEEEAAYNDSAEHETDEIVLDSPLFRITAIFSVDFDNPEQLDVNQFNFKSEFKLNPMELAWPYWLEIIASSCQRSGFMPPIVPPKRIPELEIGEEIA